MSGTTPVCVLRRVNPFWFTYHFSPQRYHSAYICFTSPINSLHPRSFIAPPHPPFLDPLHFCQHRLHVPWCIHTSSPSMFCIIFPAWFSIFGCAVFRCWKTLPIRKIIPPCFHPPPPFTFFFRFRHSLTMFFV